MHVYCRHTRATNTLLFIVETNSSCQQVILKVFEVLESEKAQKCNEHLPVWRPPVNQSCLLVPGVVYTELCRGLNVWLQLLLLPFAKLFLLVPEAGAQTTLHCALQEGIEPLSGRYFSNCALQQVGGRGRDDAVAKKLWEVSERLTGLS